MASAGKRKRDSTISVSDIDKKLQDLKEIILRKGTKLTDQDILSLVKPIIKSAEVPVSIFNNKLSTLEALVPYLVVHKELRFYEIANLLKRNQRTVWGAFNRAKRKKIAIIVEDSKFRIPLSVFADRTKAPLHVLVTYLKDNFSLTYSQIARLLDLDPRTIWTVYHKKK